MSLNPGLAKAIGVMMKLDFQRAVLNRIPKIEKNPDKYFRQAFFICDEYQHFATVGENDPSGDEKFFALSRQPKCIPIVATQSISSLRSTLPGETWRTLLQTFRTKIFLALSDEFSAKIASELCGKEEQWYSLVLSGLYVFALRPNREIKPMALPAYPDPRKRSDLFLVLGAISKPLKNWGGRRESNLPPNVKQRT